MVLNIFGNAAYGVGDQGISIDGAVPAARAGAVPAPTGLPVLVGGRWRGWDDLDAGELLAGGKAFLGDQAFGQFDDRTFT